MGFLYFEVLYMLASAYKLFPPCEAKVAFDAHYGRGRWIMPWDLAPDRLSADGAKENSSIAAAAAAKVVGAQRMAYVSVGSEVVASKGWCVATRTPALAQDGSQGHPAPRLPPRLPGFFGAYFEGKQAAEEAAKLRAQEAAKKALTFLVNQVCLPSRTF